MSLGSTTNVSETGSVKSDKKTASGSGSLNGTQKQTTGTVQSVDTHVYDPSVHVDELPSLLKKQEMKYQSMSASANNSPAGSHVGSPSTANNNNNNDDFFPEMPVAAQSKTVDSPIKKTKKNSLAKYNRVNKPHWQDYDVMTNRWKYLWPQTRQLTGQEEHMLPTGAYDTGVSVPRQHIALQGSIFDAHFFKEKVSRIQSRSGSISRGESLSRASFSRGSNSRNGTGAISRGTASTKPF